MQETVRGLSREVRLYQLVIDAFVPDQYQQLIHSHATWNDDTGEWHLVSSLIHNSTNLKCVLALREVLPMLVIM